MPQLSPRILLFAARVFTWAAAVLWGLALAGLWVRQVRCPTGDPVVTGAAVACSFAAVMCRLRRGIYTRNEALMLRTIARLSRPPVERRTLPLHRVQ